jgi:hypothetical protein
LKTNDNTAILHNVSKETAIRDSFDKEKKTDEGYNAAGSCYQFKRPLKEQNMNGSKRSENSCAVERSTEREREKKKKKKKKKKRVLRIGKKSEKFVPGRAWNSDAVVLSRIYFLY